MLSKAIIVAVALAGLGAGSAGTLWISKAIKPEIKLSCPEVKCPDNVSVELSNFDIDKINNKKGTFHLTNTLSNVRIVIEQKDSVLLKQILKAAK